MTDCTVAAPARATKAPAHSKAAPSPAPTQPPLSEGDRLALEAAEVLLGMLYGALGGQDRNPRSLHNLHFENADHLIARLLTPKDHDRDPTDPEEGDILDHLARISSELEAALEVANLSDVATLSPCEQAVAKVVIDHAFHFSERLFLAYKNLPDTLEDLRALTTNIGASNLHGESMADADEMTVATAAYEQLQECYDAHWETLHIYDSELLTSAINAVKALCEKRNTMDAQETFHFAAAALSGALLITRKEKPNSPAIEAMESVFAALDSASISYGFCQDPCEALATGIRAGARQFRERPTPPIRRVDQQSGAQAGYHHRPHDIQRVFETLETQCEALRDFSVDIRARLQGESGGVVQACNDLTIIQHMAAFMGSMCEEMSGETGGFIGGPAAWATMDGIEAIGGAA